MLLAKSHEKPTHHWYILSYVSEQNGIDVTIQNHFCARNVCKIHVEQSKTKTKKTFPRQTEQSIKLFQKILLSLCKINSPKIQVWDYFCTKCLKQEKSLWYISCRKDMVVCIECSIKHKTVSAHRNGVFSVPDPIASNPIRIDNWAWESLDTSLRLASRCYHVTGYPQDNPHRTHTTSRRMAPNDFRSSTWCYILSFALGWTQASKTGRNWRGRATEWARSGGNSLVLQSSLHGYAREDCPVAHLSYKSQQNVPLEIQDLHTVSHWRRS